MAQVKYSSKVQQQTMPVGSGCSSGGGEKSRHVPSRGGPGKVVATNRTAEQALPVAAADLTPLCELVRRTPGAHPIGSIDDLRCDAFDTEEELQEFLAFVAESRRGACGS